VNSLINQILLEKKGRRQRAEGRGQRAEGRGQKDEKISYFTLHTSSWKFST
jgi:hypothetical protein